ncbi:hypothetical protein VNO80_16181 [Phaseolus coccineus]|uniref:Uncharacterized protein n=1 Tax=Phaseolus coccineus TaxID=3886 RepID=A0AAN9R2Y2_PHACN
MYIMNLCDWLVQTHSDNLFPFGNTNLEQGKIISCLSMKTLHAENLLSASYDILDWRSVGMNEACYNWDWTQLDPKAGSCFWHIQ